MSSLLCKVEMSHGRYKGQDAALQCAATLVYLYQSEFLTSHAIEVKTQPERQAHSDFAETGHFNFAVLCQARRSRGLQKENVRLKRLLAERLLKENAELKSAWGCDPTAFGQDASTLRFRFKLLTAHALLQTTNRHAQIPTRRFVWKPTLSIWPADSLSSCTRLFCHRLTESGTGGHDAVDAPGSWMELTTI